MTSPAYQLRIENDAYASLAIFNQHKSLHFQQLLNSVASCEIELHPQDAKIASIANGNRVKIARDGNIVFGGLIQRVDWEKPKTAPSGETYKLQAWDHAIYAEWRACMCASGTLPVAYADHAGDVCKDLVYAHMGGGAAAARRFSDLTIAADAHDGAAIAVDVGFEGLLTVLKRVASGQVYWRFVPGAAGCTFTTGVPFGLDRTMGNGVNSEVVWSFDRRNIRKFAYAQNLYNHRNYVYALGQGEYAARAVREVDDAAAVALWKRREVVIDARQLDTDAKLDDRGDAELAKLVVAETAKVTPLAGQWLATTGTTWALGDKVTLMDKSYRTFLMNATIIGVDVTVNSASLEQVMPILDLEAV